MGIFHTAYRHLTPSFLRWGTPVETHMTHIPATPAEAVA
jgi:hypothetical protein